MAISKEEISSFIKTIKEVSSYDFSDYSERSFMRRVEKVLIDNKLGINELSKRIKDNKELLEKVIKDITVNTTELFRDPKTWQAIRYRVLPRFSNQKTINIWHAGCSTGQEVYSMLILLCEMELFEKANVFATDLNDDVLEVAKKGEYKYRFNINYLDSYHKVINENPYNYEDVKDIPHAKYFEVDKGRDSYKMKPFLTQKPLFRKHDLVRDGNIFYTKFDLILCRNVLIYFNSKLQNRIFDLFYQCLFSKGCLVLGAHESMSGPITAKYKKKGVIYIKK